METVESRLASEDATYRADYLRALAELNGKPQLCLPLPPDRPTFKPSPVLTPFSVPVCEHTFDPESRFDVLDRITVRKTVKPGLRVVHFDGLLVGKIARNPYGPGWLASCSRSTMFWSISDAALALVADAGVLP